jgi:putative transposase
VCRRHGISDATLYNNWKAKYGGLEVSQARRLKALEDENTRLKKLLAEAMLDNAVLKDVAPKSRNARCSAGRCHGCAPGAWGERAAGVLDPWHRSIAGADLPTVALLNILVGPKQTGDSRKLRNFENLFLAVSQILREEAGPRYE